MSNPRKKAMKLRLKQILKEKGKCNCADENKICEKKLEECQSQYAELKKQFATIDNDLVECQSQYAELKKQFATIDNDLVECQSQYAELKDIYQKLLDECSSLKKQNEKLEKKLAKPKRKPRKKKVKEGE